MNIPAPCPHCNLSVDSTFLFCPYCGKKIHEQALSTSVFTQIVVYLFSFLLPPFGLGRAFRYLKQEDSTSKFVGIMIIILTIASIWLSIALASSFMNSYSRQIDDQMRILDGY